MNGELKVYCRDLNRYGQGVCIEIDSDALPLDGKSILFVDGLLPGESAYVSVTETKRNYRKAITTRRINDSTDRMTPPCPIEENCGGCQIQDLSYAAGLAWKEKNLRENLQRIGAKEFPSFVQPIIGADEPFANYRNKMAYPVGRINSLPVLGFYRPRSHDLISTPVCLIEPPGGSFLRERVAELIHKYQIPVYDEKTGHGDLRHLTIRSCPQDTGNARADLMLIFTTQRDNPVFLDLADELIRDDAVCSVYLNIQPDPGNVILGDEFILLAGEKKLHFTLDGTKYSLSPAAFFQINYAQTVRLYRLLAELVQDILHRQQLDQIIDLYCGVGSIGIYLINNLRQRSDAPLPHLLGIELVEAAVRDAVDNADLNDFTPDQYSFVAAAAEESLDLLKTSKKTTDNTLTIVDPPRKGLDDRLTETLLEHGSRHLIYVSCNPATLARDLKKLAESYSIQLIQPLDMFPWTTHVETVVLMSRVDK